jgi:hypothetical protein
VPLGVLNKDEAKVVDMIDIMENYHKLVPRRGEEPVPTILYGDGLSCERANDARNARINADNPWARLEGIEPAIQEWHRRAIQMTVSRFIYLPDESKCNTYRYTHILK